MQPRTKRQKEIFDFISNYIERHGYRPSYQMIAKHLGLKSKGGIAKHIETMEKQGILSRYRQNGSFSLQINRNETFFENICEIPWLKLPFDDEFSKDYEDEPLYVPYFMIGDSLPEKFCAFRVRNNAMKNEQIVEDDIVLLEKKSFARDGETTLALIEGEKIMFKRFYRKGAEIEFRPANEEYETVRFSGEKVEVLGVYRALLRPLV